MTRTVDLRIFTLADISQVEITKVLWQHLARAPVAPAKYDTVERAKLPFTSESYVDAANLYKEEYVLFVTGASHAYQVMFSKEPKNLAKWNFYLSHEELQQSRGQAWHAWIKDLAVDLPILFGFFCGEEEYNAKHQIVEYYEGLGSSTGAVGVATREFWQFLPGVYWLNLFGPEAIGDIELSRVKALQDWQTELHDSKLLTIQYHGPVLPYDPEVRTEPDHKLCEALGAEHIFSRDEPTDNLHQLPGILKALGSL